MSNTDLAASLQEAKDDLVQKFTDARLDAYERGLRAGGLAILDTLLNEDISPIFALDDADEIVAALTEYRRRLQDVIETS